MTSDNQSAVAFCFNQAACVYLPNATTLDVGAAKFTLKNLNDTTNITIYDHCQRPFNILTPCQSLQLSLYDNSDVCGKWIHEKPTTNLTGVGVAQTVDVTCLDADIYCTNCIDCNTTAIIRYKCSSCQYISTVGKFSPSTSSYTFSTPCCVTLCAQATFETPHIFYGSCSEDNFAIWHSNKTGPQVVTNKDGGICLCCMPNSCTGCWGTKGWGTRGDYIDRFVFLNPICDVTSLCFEYSFGCINTTTGVMCRYDFQCICECGFNSTLDRACITCFANHTEMCHFMGTVKCRINYSVISPAYADAATGTSSCRGIRTVDVIAVRVPNDGAATDSYCAYHKLTALGRCFVSCYCCYNDCIFCQCVCKGACFIPSFPASACCFTLYYHTVRYDTAGIYCCFTSSMHVNGTTGHGVCCACMCSAQPFQCRACLHRDIWTISENYYFYDIFTGGNIDAKFAYTTYNGSKTVKNCIGLRCDNSCGCCSATGRICLFQGHCSIFGGQKRVCSAHYKARYLNEKFHDPDHILQPSQYCPLECSFIQNKAHKYGHNTWYKRISATCGCFIWPFNANPDASHNCVTYCVLCWNGSTLNQSVVTSPCNFGDPYCTTFFRQNAAGAYEYVNLKCGTVGCFTNGATTCHVIMDCCAINEADAYVPIDNNFKYLYLFPTNGCYAYCICRDANCCLVPCGSNGGPQTSPGAATGVNVSASRVTPASSACGSIISYQNACNAFLPTAVKMSFNCTDLKFDNKTCFNLDTIPVSQQQANLTAEGGGYIYTCIDACVRAFSFLTINP
jgi:hypothetical protein